ARSRIVAASLRGSSPPLRRPWTATGGAAGSLPSRPPSPPPAPVHQDVHAPVLRHHRRQLRPSSSMERATTLSEVLASVREQLDEDDVRRAIEKPKPWFALLRDPGRAAWRSTDRPLGSANSRRDADGGREDGGESALARTRFNLLKASGRTNKQLRRTYAKITETHRELAAARERERRAAANLSNSRRAAAAGSNADGSVKDSKGRKVGDWRERGKGKGQEGRADGAPAHLCDDPSVALALSTGLSGMKRESRNRDDGSTASTSDDATNFRRKGQSKGPSAHGRPVGYGPEQAATNLRYRLGPNHSILRRVLLEARSLLGGTPPEGSNRRAFRPKRVLDFGCGVGSAGAAALDVFGPSRKASEDGPAAEGIDWIHSIDASRPMREMAEKVLTCVLEGAPWEAEAEEEEDDGPDEYDELVKRLRGDGAERREERRRKRMKKFERTWAKRDDYRTRLTFGESIVDASSSQAWRGRRLLEEEERPPLPWQKALDEQRLKASQKKADEMNAASSGQGGGSFDLVLSSYTLSELPDVNSSLAAAALLWEKLGPDGVLVLVEPGTPDGFGILRSVRSMLLECCPPSEIRAARRRRERGAENGDGDDDGGDDKVWHEECHVIAPCTHNGSCPMERHRRDHVKKAVARAAVAKPEEGGGGEDENDGGSSDGGIEAGNESVDEDIDEEEEEEEEEEDDDDEGEEVPARQMLEEWDTLSPEERQAMKEMMDLEDFTDEELVAMMEEAVLEEEEGEAEGDRAESESDDEGDSDGEDEVDSASPADAEFYDIAQETPEPSQPSSKSTARRTDVFDTSFCSFVHGFPNDVGSKRGEKFSYLVLQKRVLGHGTVGHSAEGDALDEVDITDLLARSVYHAQKAKEEDLEKLRERQRFNREGPRDDDDHKTYDGRHRKQLYQIGQKAIEVEREYLDSSRDSLGLELLGGDRRKGWGRLVRAPLKRKGHVLLDYCTAGCGTNGGCGKNGSGRDDEAFESDDEIVASEDGTRGRIVRQGVGRGWSARAAPGCHAAARKARWGGLWPDLSERVDILKKQDEKDERRIQESGSLGS
ncbi:hypothetical protein ACHAWF_014000, partial [Thalassiosira exigua]